MVSSRVPVAKNRFEPNRSRLVRRQSHGTLVYDLQLPMRARSSRVLRNPENYQGH
jgi:hypothetical protein